MTCSHCSHPLYAGIRCGDCGRWTDEKEEEMNRDDILRMAREAGFTNPEKFTTTDENLKGILSDFWENLERFAALVAAAEREACAKLVFQTQESDDEYVSLRETIALAIRARGEK